jgi:hypothetical protein
VTALDVVQAAAGVVFVVAIFFLVWKAIRP